MFAYRPARPHAGFTLVEVLIASAVVGIVFLCLYSGMAYGFTMIKMSRENLRATQILVEKMETIRLYNWEQITSTNFIPTTFTNTYYPPGGKMSGGVVYIGTMTIKDTILDSAPNYQDQMKVVTVTVTWESGQKTRQRSIKTYVTEFGLHNYVY